MAGPSLFSQPGHAPRTLGTSKTRFFRGGSSILIMATGHLPMHEFASKPWLTPDAMLQRPFSEDDLLATVKRVLRTDEVNKAHMEMLLPKYL